MEILTAPGIRFLKDFGTFLMENRSKFATEIQENHTRIRNAGTCKKACFSMGTHVFLQVTGIDN